MLVFALTTLPALLAQPPAPVDYAALRRDLRESVIQLNTERSAWRQSGQPMKAYQPDLDAAIAPLRAKYGQATGELRDALRLMELQLAFVAQMPDRKARTQGLLAEILPTNPAWRVIPGFGFQLEFDREMQGEGKAYAERLKSEGVPEVRMAILGAHLEFPGTRNKPEVLQELVARIQKEFPQTPLAAKAREAAQSLASLSQGRVAPDFAVEDVEKPGRRLTLADFKGKFLLLDFWGTWCQYCVKELPTTHRLYEAYKAKGLEILSLAADNTAEQVQAFRKKPGTPMPWRHGLAGSRKDPHPVVKAFDVQSFPSLFLIGPDGRILASGEALREKALEKTLATFLK